MRSKISAKSIANRFNDAPKSRAPQPPKKRSAPTLETTMDVTKQPTFVPNAEALTRLDDDYDDDEWGDSPEDKAEIERRVEVAIPLVQEWVTEVFCGEGVEPPVIGDRDRELIRDEIIERGRLHRCDADAYCMANYTQEGG